MHSHGDRGNEAGQPPGVGLLSAGQLDPRISVQPIILYRALLSTEISIFFSIAGIRLRRSDLDSGELDQIRDDLAQAFEILTKLGRPDGIGVVGLLFAEVLVTGGDQKTACEVLAKAEAAFEKIDDTVGVERVRRFRERIEGDSTLDQ